MPEDGFEYVEAVFSRNMQLQANAASYVATGALTGLTVLLAIYSVLVTLAYQTGHSPPMNVLAWSLGIGTASGLGLGVGWYFCNMKQETDPLGVADDIIGHDQSVNFTRQKVVISMIKNYSRNSRHLRLGQG